MTGTHFDNGEDIQIVRYEPGQFYRVHHDQVRVRVRVSIGSGLG